MSSRDTVKPTRMELLRLKARIKLANKGLNLLKQKRAALIAEFFNNQQESTGSKKAAEPDNAEEYVSLAVAEHVPREDRDRKHRVHGQQDERTFNYYEERHGREDSRASGERQGLSVQLISGYALMGLSVKVDETIINFESALKIILDIAEVENSLRRILVEIHKTKRRVNSIENVLIPRLKGKPSTSP